MRRSFLLPALAALTLTAAPAWAAGVKVATEKLAKETDAYTISVEYPKTGNGTIDDEIGAYAHKEYDDFVKLATEDRQPDEQPYELEVTFEVGRNDATGFGVLFTIYTFTGGAHPNHDFTTFNYMMPEGWRVYLPEIFNGGAALKKISGLAIADLTKELAGPDGGSDPDTIKDGAGPAWDNFQDFILKPSVLDINFPPYQVAAYAAGPQEVKIPLSQLKALMRADWKAPAASFDCTKAGTAIEKAICSDVALARLDRNVSEAYARKLKYSFEQADRDKAKADQRAFIADRDGKCGSGDVACLTQAYTARLAVLEAEPE